MALQLLIRSNKWLNLTADNN